MPFNRSAVKQRAKALLRSAVPSAILVTMVFSLFTSTLFNVVDIFSPNIFDQILLMYTTGRSDQIYSLLHTGIGIGVFLSILMFLYNVVMNFGYLIWSLRIWRQQPAGYTTLLDGFSMVNRILLLNLQIFLRQFAWAFLIMLLIGIPIGMVTALISSTALQPLTYGFLMICIAICIVFVYARYALAQYILIDQPDLPIRLVIHQSVKLMKGQIWDFIKIYLSFFGWEILFALVINLVGVVVYVLTLGYVPDDLYDRFMGLTTLSLPFWVMHVISLPLVSWLTAYQIFTLSGFYDHIAGGQPADLLQPGQDAGF